MVTSVLLSPSPVARIEFSLSFLPSILYHSFFMEGLVSVFFISFVYASFLAWFSLLLFFSSPAFAATYDKRDCRKKFPPPVYDLVGGKYFVFFFIFLGLNGLVWSAYRLGFTVTRKNNRLVALQLKSSIFMHSRGDQWGEGSGCSQGGKGMGSLW